MISIDCIGKDTARTPDARDSPCKPFQRRRNRAPTISWPRPTVSLHTGAANLVAA